MASRRPPGTPDHVVIDGDPVRCRNHATVLHDRKRVAERLVLPLLLGSGMHLTPTLSPGADLRFERSRPLPGGSVETSVSAAAAPTAPA